MRVCTRVSQSSAAKRLSGSTCALQVTQAGLVLKQNPQELRLGGCPRTLLQDRGGSAEPGYGLDINIDVFSQNSNAANISVITHVLSDLSL